jgi:tRNA(Ile)-lysidine synthase
VSILQDQFIQYWKEKNYVLPGRMVLLAVSGGMDSMVMAHLFLSSNIPFAAAHCNFGLRASESDLDEQLITGWCAQNNIRLHAIKFDTKSSAQLWKKGTQETARALRYEWFEEIRKEHNYSKIVTAHHAGDNVETLLINLFKGTGISGLHGILPENGYIARPLLFAPKETIRAYAAENNVPYRDDASNATDDYLRNAVRHHIIPAAEQWFPNAVARVNESIKRFADAEILYHKAIGQERKKLLDKRGQDYYIPILKLRHREPLETILYELLQPFGFSPGQAPHVADLLKAESGHYVPSATHRIIRNRDFLIVTAMPAAEADLILIESAPCTIDTGKYVFSFSLQQRPKAIPAAKNEAWLDLDEMQFPLILRKWRMGDYFYPFGMKMKKKKISRLLIDEKVPLHEKENVRILESNKRIAWVCGMRPDERFKIKTATTQVLVVKIEAKDKN